MDRKETFVSDELATMLMLQISHEQKNANLYAAISNYFDSIGLEGCHQWFKHQTEEENLSSLAFGISTIKMDASDEEMLATRGDSPRSSRSAQACVTSVSKWSGMKRPK